MKIALDAGHGIDTYPLTGSKGVPGMAEFEFNSAVAGYAKKMLESAGYQVILTQPLDGNSVPLPERLNIAVTSKVDLIASIHADWYKDPYVNGFWVFYWHESDAGKRFAEVWLRHAEKLFPHKSRGVVAGEYKKLGNFYITRKPHGHGIPAVLIEHGFMTNAKDLELLLSDEFRRLAAKVIVNAVSEMFPLTNPDWRVAMGEKAVSELHAKGLINNPEQIVDFKKPLPAWKVLELFNRVSKEPPN